METIGWFRWPQLLATGDWQLHHNNMPAHVSHLMQRFLVKHEITQVTQCPYTPQEPWDFWLFPNVKSLWRRRDFRPLMRFRKIRRSSWLQLRELGEIPRCLLWRELRYYCPMYNVSCILYLLQYMSLFLILLGWIPSGQTSYVWMTKFERIMIEPKEVRWPWFNKARWAILI